MPNHAGQLWTPEEDAVLERLWGAAGMDVIALALGRTASAVSSRWYELHRPKRGRRRGMAWSAEEDARFLPLALDESLSWRDVSERMPGRSPKSCAAHAKALGLPPRMQKNRAEQDGEAPPDMLSRRRCHDCGRPTVDYRCPRCLAKWRERNGVSSAGRESDEYEVFGARWAFD